MERNRRDAISLNRLGNSVLAAQAKRSKELRQSKMKKGSKNSNILKYLKIENPKLLKLIRRFFNQRQKRNYFKIY